MQNHLRGDHGTCLNVFFNVFVSVTPNQVCSGWSILGGETIHNFADTPTHLPLVALQFWSGVTFLWQPGYKKSKDQLGPCVAPRNVRFHSKVYRAASNIWVVMAAMFIPWDPLRVPVAGCFPWWASQVLPGGQPEFLWLPLLPTDGFDGQPKLSAADLRLECGRQAGFMALELLTFISVKEEWRTKNKVQSANCGCMKPLYIIYMYIYIYLSLSLFISYWSPNIPPFSGSFSPGHQRPQRRCRPPSQTCPARCSSSWRPGQVLHGACGGLGFRVGNHDSNNSNTIVITIIVTIIVIMIITIMIITRIITYGPKKPKVSWFFDQHLWWSLPSMTSKNWIWMEVS
jgi:hypothetical protein